LGTYRFVPTTSEHVSSLIQNIHPDIVKELETLVDAPFEVSVRKCVESANEAWTAITDDGVTCIFGIKQGSLLSSQASPWFLASKYMKNHKKTLLYLTKIGLKYWQNKYGDLINYVPSNYPETIRWLKWAGFTLYPPLPVGVGGHMIHKIEMRKI